MSLEGNEQENYAANTGHQEAKNEGNKPPRELPPINNSPQSPQSPSSVGKIPSATVIFINTGKRPAKVLISEAGDGWFVKFPTNPAYATNGIKSSSITVPNSPITNKFNLFKTPMSQVELSSAIAGNPKLFIYANIEYIDVDTGTKHFSHSCWVYVGNDPVVAKGFYNCSEYQQAN